MVEREDGTLNYSKVLVVEIPEEAVESIERDVKRMSTIGAFIDCVTVMELLNVAGKDLVARMLAIGAAICNTEEENRMIIDRKDSCLPPRKEV